MIIFMPKYSYYNSLSTSAKINADKYIKEAIDNFVEDGIEVFIEDELSINYFKEKKIYSCTSKREIPSIVNMTMYGDYTLSMSALVEYAENIALDYKKAKMPDMVLAYRDKEAYDKLYRKYYFERTQDNISEFLRRKQVALVFKGNKRSNLEILPTASENDGILYIYVNLDTGIIEGSYSGMWVNKDMIQKILGGIYGLHELKNK